MAAAGPFETIGPGTLVFIRSVVEVVWCGDNSKKAPLSPKCKTWGQPTVLASFLVKLTNDLERLIEPLVLVMAQAEVRLIVQLFFPAT